MAESTHKGKAPNQILGLVLCIITPATMVIMLGLFGINLLGTQLSYKAPPQEEEAEATTVAAMSSSPAPAAEAAPAATETPAEAPTEVAAADTATPDAAPAGGGAAADPAAISAGKTVFGTYCAACHGPDGKSPLVPGMAPSLADSKILSGGNKASIMTLLHGIKPEGKFTGVMISWAPALNDEQIANVLTYLRSDHVKASPISAAQVAKGRTMDMPAQPARAELEAMDGDISE